MLNLEVVYTSMDSLERMCMSPDQEPDFPVQVMCSERLAGSCGGRALLHSLESHGEVREAYQGLMEITLVSRLSSGVVIRAVGEQVGGRISSPNPCHDVTLFLKHKRKDYWSHIASPFAR